MNLLIRWHRTMLLWHLTWLNFWMRWEPEPPDTTAATADRWLRERVTR